MSTILDYPAPNISLVFESTGNGTVSEDGVPPGCYASIHYNKSDVSYFSVEYPILDYSKIDPVQVQYEGPLTIMSMYQLANDTSTTYKDLLETSLSSFDMVIWSVIIISILVFSSLLVVRKWLDNTKQDSFSSIFETLSHLVGQQSTDFDDTSGRIISMTMTFFLFIVVIGYYFNLMSTDLVVVIKPKVFNNYRDVMEAKNMTVAFSAATSDINEFETANKGSIQERFWSIFENKHIIFDFATDMGRVLDGLNQIIDGKTVLLLYSQYSDSIARQCCKFKSIHQKDVPKLRRTYGWLSSDPEGKQRTVGLIMRQGIKDDLIIKGLRRLKGVAEGGLFTTTYSLSMDRMEVGLMFEGTVSVEDMVKCASKKLNYNQPTVETFNLQNLKYLFVISVALLLVSFIVLVFENVHKMTEDSRVTPL